MGFWDLMIKKDDFIVSMVENVRHIKNNINPTLAIVHRQMLSKPLMGKGKDLYILLNAPSLKTQDLSVLKGKDTMFVNRGFMHPMFRPYIEKGTKIYWSKNILPFYNLGVSGECFSFGIEQQYDRIYFAGFDATGIGHEMVKSADSHFYGNDKELEGKSTKQFVVDLLMHSRHLHDLNRLADYCKKRNVALVNITNGGLLDMFPRKNILPLLK